MVIMSNRENIRSGNLSIEETVRRYNEIAAEYGSDWRGKLDGTQLIQPEKFEKLIGLPPRRILDAGCGTGKHSVYFARRGYDVTGIDMSAGMIEEAAKNSTGLSINFALRDMRSLTFLSNFFDGVWTVAAIAHLTSEDKQGFIREAHRVLKRDGVFYISSQNLFSVKHLARLVKFYLRHLACSHGRLIDKIKTIVNWAKEGYLFLDERHWFFPKKSLLLRMLNEAGFTVVDSNSCFSNRLSVYARKVVVDPKGGK